MPSRSRFVTLATTNRPTFTDVEACHLPQRTKRMPLASNSSYAEFVPIVGDSYVRCRHPVSGIERRCVITAISSLGGSFASVRFFDGDELATDSEPVIVSVSALEPLMYPPLDLQDGALVPKSKLLLTCPATGLNAAEAARRLAAFGPNIVPEMKREKLPELLQCCWGSMPCMIWTATFVSVLRAAWPDCAVLLMLQLVNGLVGWREEMKAADAISALKASLQPQTLCRRGGIDTDIPASTLVPGDIVLLSAGSAVPADCELLSGSVQVDTVQATGQQAPETMEVGRIALTGCEIISGTCEAVVFDHGPQTHRAKTAARMAKDTDTVDAGEFQKVLARTTSSLTVVSLLLVCIVCALLLYRNYDRLDVVSFGVVLTVATVPIAVPVVWRSALAIGARALAHQAGAILTSLCGMERLASIDVLCLSCDSETVDDTAEVSRQARTIGVQVKLLHSLDDQYSSAVLNSLRHHGLRYGLTGHGVQDAAPMRRADLGIALHGATDTTHAASDLVLTTPNLVTIVDAVVLSREILQGLLSYVIHRVACSMLLLSVFVATAVPALLSPAAYNGMSPACQLTYSTTTQEQVDNLEQAHMDARADVNENEQHITALATVRRQLCHQQFTLPVTAIVLFTILNDATILSIPYDMVTASCHPAKWRLRDAVLPSILLGCTSALASMVLLYCGLTANAAGSWFVSLGIIELPAGSSFNGLEYDWQIPTEKKIQCSAKVFISGDEATATDSSAGCDWSMCSPPGWSELTTSQRLGWRQPSFCFRYEQLQTMLFLQISLSTYMTIWSARSRRSALRSGLPGLSLVVASVSAMLAASFFAWKWPFAELEPLPLWLVGWIWLYCAVWFCVQDTAKMVLYNILDLLRCKTDIELGSNSFLHSSRGENKSAGRSVVPPRLAPRGVNKTCPVLPTEDVCNANCVSTSIQG